MEEGSDDGLPFEEAFSFCLVPFPFLCSQVRAILTKMQIADEALLFSIGCGSK